MGSRRGSRATGVTEKGDERKGILQLLLFKFHYGVLYFTIRDA
jgi:hypothetical protein